jgi:hypothetical protein
MKVPPARVPFNPTGAQSTMSQATTTENTLHILNSAQQREHLTHKTKPADIAQHLAHKTKPADKQKYLTYTKAVQHHKHLTHSKPAQRHTTRVDTQNSTMPYNTLHTRKQHNGIQHCADT